MKDDRISLGKASERALNKIKGIVMELKYEHGKIAIENKVFIFTTYIWVAIRT